MANVIENIKKDLGITKNSTYVRDYFYKTNMRASIYMSVIIIVLEIWMIVRLTHIIIRDNLYGNLAYYIERYYSNYFVLITAGITMLIFATRYLRGKAKSRVLGRLIMYAFTAVCIYFGITVSVNDYGIGEQLLVFMTMMLFAVCLLTWRPVIAFLILTASYAIIWFRISGMVAVNTGKVGLTDATKINGFIMWLSTLMVCIANYHRIYLQALKDENLEHVNQHLSEISVKDELTGIHNMLYFRAEAEKLLQYVTTDRDNIVYLFLDIENFKSYNEKYGFHAGNELLIMIAQTIEKSFQGSLVSRFSDDHFVVLTNIEHCREAVAEIAAELKKCQREVRLELKCGAYKPCGDEADPSVACDRARFACNSIKKHCGRFLQFYNKTLEDQFHLKQYIVNNIDNAIANNYIKVYYQPVVSTETGKICGLEALARWEDPNYGLLMPGAFISILEEYRQIYKLDRYVVEQVCKDYCQAKEAGEPFAPVSLNFSRLDFELCDIVGYLAELVERYHVPKAFMDIEITESALVDQKEFLPDALKALRSHGFLVWLDDFGSGYSSLNVLKDYHFDVLKIDMKFLSGFGSNAKTCPILRNIINLSQQLQMVSLTEGVETHEQFEFLQKIGCDRVQGYLFGKPTPLSTLLQRIHDGELVVDEEFWQPQIQKAC